MPCPFETTFAYDEGQHLLPIELGQNSECPIVNPLDDEEIDEEDTEEDDSEEIEDEEELEDLEANDNTEEFDEIDNVFAEEENVLNQRMYDVLPMYSTLPNGYNADADSFQMPSYANVDNFNAERDNLTQGMIFNSKEDLQHAVKEWSIRNNRKFSVRKGGSSKKCWEVYCKMKIEQGCAWRLRGSLQSRTHGFWEIITITPHHTCVFSTTQKDHPNMTAGLITQAITHLVAEDPSIRIKMIVAEIQKQYKITIGYNKAWYAKQKAISVMYGDWKESYARLPKLLLALKHRNPGTHVSMFKAMPEERTRECQLLRVFWAFGPSLEGFKSCRPVMSIDATHLYGKYKGKLLIALGVDGNGQIFPVGFGLVQEESKVEWGWFLRKLRNVVGDRPNICLISDRHKAIIRAVRDPLNGWAEPTTTHRFCLRHVRANFMQLVHSTVLKKKVWKIGSEIEPREFEKGLAELERLHPRGYEYMKAIPKEMWSLSYDGGHRYGCMTTNLVECFNGVLLGGRNLPVCAMVMLIYQRLVQYFLEKRNNAFRMESVNLHGLTDRGIKLTEKSREHARNLWVSQLYDRTDGTAQVVSNLNHLQHVNLSTRTCGCGSWAQYKVPCGHALKVCMELNIDYKRFVHSTYTVAVYRQTYSAKFIPLEHEDYWPQYDGPTLIPPVFTERGIGRPRSSRFRNEMDESSAVQHKHCSRCRQQGHTIRRCTTPNVV